MDTRFEALDERIARSEDGIRLVEAGQVELQRGMADIMRVLSNLNTERNNRSSDREEGGGSHNGGGARGDNRTEHEKKLEMPIFSGENIQEWLARVERYFEVNHMIDAEKLPAVLIVLDCEALHWYRWWEKITREMTWELFRTDVVGRFKPDLIGDPFRELFRLKQTRIVQEYRRDFERINSTVGNVDEVFLRGIWLNGVTESIREELLIEPTDSLERMMKKAQRLESRNLALTCEVGGSTGSMRTKGPWSYSQARNATQQNTNVNLGQTFTRPITNTTYAGSGSVGSTPTEVSRNLGQNWGRSNAGMGGGSQRPDLGGSGSRTNSWRLPQAELQERSRKGLCFHCEERWSPTHRCRMKQLHLLIVEDDDDGDEGGGPSENFMLEKVEAPEVEEPKLQLSTQSLLGLSSSRTMRMWGDIDGTKVIVLIDCGASHNFIKNTLVQPLRLVVADTPQY